MTLNQIEITPVLFGEIRDAAVEYFELPGPPADPNSLADVVTSPNPAIVQQDQAIQVCFKWRAVGLGFDLINAPDWQWKCEIALEKYGQGDSPNPSLFPSAIVNHVMSFDKTYPVSPATTVTIPPGTLPIGVYKMVAMLTLVQNSSGRTPVAGFVELGPFRITHR